MMTTRKALKQVIDSYPDYTIFTGIDLLRKVKLLIDKKNCFDGSIFRIMRYCRDRYKDFNYKIENQHKSQYRKLPVYSEPIYRAEESGQLCLI